MIVLVILPLTVYSATWNLESMTKLAMGFSAWNFNGYGCHCGLGGDPETPPIDAVDECCYHHDRCYGYINEVYKITKFLTPYYWYTKFENGYRVNCSRNWLTFARKLCICDARLVACWKRWAKPVGSGLPPLKKKCVKITHFGYWWSENDIGVNPKPSNFFGPWKFRTGRMLYSVKRNWTKPPNDDYFVEGTTHYPDIELEDNQVE